MDLGEIMGPALLLAAGVIGYYTGRNQERARRRRQADERAYRELPWPRMLDEK